MTTEIGYARMEDRAFWFSLDRHLPESEYENKVRERRAYVLRTDGKPVGLLRWQLFWDNTPFCSLIIIDPAFRGQGLGRRLMAHWEADARARGFGIAMTSTQADETAQHFYRRLGYVDCGGFVLPVPGYEQPLELMMAKKL